MAPEIAGLCLCVQAIHPVPIQSGKHQHRYLCGEIICCLGSIMLCKEFSKPVQSKYRFVEVEMVDWTPRVKKPGSKK